MEHKTAFLLVYFKDGAPVHEGIYMSKQEANERARIYLASESDTAIYEIPVQPEAPKAPRVCKCEFCRQLINWGDRLIYRYAWQAPEQPNLYIYCSRACAELDAKREIASIGRTDDFELYSKLFSIQESKHA